MKNLVLGSQIVVLFLMILFIGSYFAMDKYVSSEVLLKTLLYNAPISLVGSVLAVVVGNWTLKRQKARGEEF